MTPPIQYDLADGSAHCRRLLNAMTTETVSKDEVRNDRVGTNYPILIQSVVVIVTSPSRLHLCIYKLTLVEHKCVQSTLVAVTIATGIGAAS